MRTPRSPWSAPLCAVLLLALLWAPLASDTLVPDATAAEEEMVLNIGEDVTIEDFLKSVAAATGKSLVWNPADKNIRGKKIMGGVNLRSTKSEFFGLVRGLLTFYELVMIPVGPADAPLILIMDARQTSSILKLKPEHVVLTDDNLDKYEHADGLFITTVIEVKNMDDLRNARNALTRIVTGQNIGNVTEVPNAKAFVVTDFAPNVVSIYRLLRTMDQPNAAASTTSGKTVAIAMKHGKAVEAAAVLNQHFAAKPKSPQRQQPMSTTAKAPRITADARTNQILLTGTPDQISTVELALSKIDVPILPVGLEKHQMYYIRLVNIQAEEAAMALTELLMSAEGLRGPGPSAAPRPHVVSHSETDALLVSASKSQFEAISALVKQMDVKPMEAKAEGK